MVDQDSMESQDAMARTTPDQVGLVTMDCPDSKDCLDCQEIMVWMDWTVGRAETDIPDNQEDRHSETDYQVALETRDWMDYRVWTANRENPALDMETKASRASTVSLEPKEIEENWELMDRKEMMEEMAKMAFRADMERREFPA